MKNLKITVVVLGFIAIVTACGRPGRHVVISEDDGNGGVKIEYLGRTYFSDDSTSITRITPNGFAKYEKDGQSLFASRDGRGDITYQINGSEKQRHLSSADKVFLTRAVKDMIKRGHYND